MFLWSVVMASLYIRIQGPALCVYNDAVFSEEDWRGIRMLSQSVKHSDSFKVGRFGIGFKSVFHLTGEFRKAAETSSRLYIICMRGIAKRRAV